MKDNIIGIVGFALFFFSLFLSAVTGFPYVVYFFIVVPIVAIIGIYVMSFFENKRIKKQREEFIKKQQEQVLKIELDKKKKQEEWDKLPQEEKDIILKENKRKQKEKSDKIWKEYKQQQLIKKNAEKLVEQRRLQEISIKEEDEKNEKERQLILAKEKEEKDKEKEENRIKQILEQKEIRERNQKEAIKRKILENERKKQLESEAIQELLDAGLIDNNHYTGKNMRESIPTDVKVAVWQRDKERCVSCFSNVNLEFDHIIPVSKGGANSIKNIQLLCRNCNRTKSNKII